MLARLRAMPPGTACRIAPLPHRHYRSVLAMMKHARASGTLTAAVMVKFGGDDDPALYAAHVGEPCVSDELPPMPPTQFVWTERGRTPVISPTPEVEVVDVQDDVDVVPQREVEEEGGPPEEVAVPAPGGVPLDAAAILGPVPCPHCGMRGLYTERDRYGRYVGCRHCGWCRDLVRGAGRVVTALAGAG